MPLLCPFTFFPYFQLFQANCKLKKLREALCSLYDSDCMGETVVSSDSCYSTDRTSSELTAVAGVKTVYANIAERLELAWLQQETGSWS